MLSGIYSNHYDNFAELVTALPSDILYPKDSSVIPYKKDSLFFFYLPSEINRPLDIYINDNFLYSVTVDDEGYLFFSEDIPYGDFELKIKNGNNLVYSNKFSSKYAHEFVYIISQLFKDSKIESLKLFNDTFLMEGDYYSQKIREGALTDNYGSYFDFPKPPDWDYDFYHKVLIAANQSLQTASSLQGVKGIIKVVTNYDIDIDNLLPLQESEDFVVGDSNVDNPVNSLIQKGFTYVVKIKHQGFDRQDVPVKRTRNSNIDTLDNDWINIYAPVIYNEYDFWGESFDIDPNNRTYTFTGEYSQNYISVYLNGLYIPSTLYTLNNNSITLANSLELANGDTLWITGYKFDDSLSKREEVYTIPDNNPVEYTLSYPCIPSTLRVYLNGLMLARNVSYTFDGTKVTILTATKQGDTLILEYHSQGNNWYKQEYAILNNSQYTLNTSANLKNVWVYLNGINLRGNGYDWDIASNIITLYVSVTAGDSLYVEYIEDIPYGNNVKIYQGNQFYYQDVDFLINYPKGQVIWLTQNKPADDSVYFASYNYFPKTILEHLFKYVTPATIRIKQQYLYTKGTQILVYNPYFWNGQENPSGDIIL